MKSAHKFLQLAPAQQWFWLKSWLTLLTITGCFRVLPYAWLKNRVVKPLLDSQPVAIKKSSNIPVKTIEALFLSACYRQPLTSTCLHRSLTLKRLLTQQGLEAKIIIGVKKEQGKLMAHAWIDHKGQALADTDENINQYKPLANLEQGALLFLQ